ncbi:hypothetical protein [Bradyrhizobium sp. USDA 4454]
MVKNSYADLSHASEEVLATLESLIRGDYERCHPGETLDDLKRRASFSKEDRGLLRDWMTVAAMRQRSRPPTRSCATPVAHP